jgi:hypothetical protein
VKSKVKSQFSIDIFEERFITVNNVNNMLITLITVIDINQIFFRKSPIPGSKYHNFLHPKTVRPLFIFLAQKYEKLEKNRSKF